MAAVDWLTLDTRTFTIPSLSYTKAFSMMSLHRKPPWGGFLLRLCSCQSPGSGRSGCRELARVSQAEAEDVATTNDHARLLQLAHITFHAKGRTKAKGKTFVGWTCPAMGQPTCFSTTSCHGCNDERSKKSNGTTYVRVSFPKVLPI